MTGRIYVGSNVLIYFVDGAADLKAQAQRRLGDHIQSGDQLFSSELALGECLRGAWRQGNVIADAFQTTLTDRAFITLTAIDRALIVRAAQLGAELNMKLVDAIHVATAEALECSVFLTNDRGIRAPAAIEVRPLGTED